MPKSFQRTENIIEHEGDGSWSPGTVLKGQEKRQGEL